MNKSSVLLSSPESAGGALNRYNRSPWRDQLSSSSSLSSSSCGSFLLSPTNFSHSGLSFESDIKSPCRSIGLPDKYSASSEADTSTSAAETSLSVSFEHTSKGKLRYDPETDITELISNLNERKPISTRNADYISMKNDVLSIKKQTKNDVLSIKKQNNTEDVKPKEPALHKSLFPSQKKPKKLKTQEDSMVEAKEALEIKFDEFCAHEKQLKVEKEKGYMSSVWHLNERRAKKEQELLANDHFRSMEAERRMHEFSVCHEQHKNTVTAKICQLHEEDKMKKEQKKTEMVMAIRNEQKKVKALWEERTRLISSCRFQQHLPSQTIQNHMEVMQRILIRLTQLVDDAQRGDDILIEHVKQFTEQAEKILQLTVPLIESANQKGEEEMKKAQEGQEALKKQQQLLQLQQQQQKQLESQTSKKDHQSSKQETSGQSAANGALLVAKQTTEILKVYDWSKDLITATEKKCEVLSKKTDLTSYKFDLMNAIGKSVNAVQHTEAIRLRENFNYINRLLHGEVVEFVNKRVSTKNHELAPLFAKNCFAQKIVKQSKGAAAKNCPFALASLIVRLWCEHKDLGELILAYFHKICPYTIPVYLPRGTETTEEYYRKLGYQLVDGAAERTDSFQNRMAEYVKLYASVLVSHPPSYSPHPHGIQHAWKWLSRIVNLDPLKDITAVILEAFLKITGNSLSKVYGRQFWKLFIVIKNEYLPKIHAVEGDTSSFCTLENLLNEVLGQRYFKEPKGILPSSIWSSRPCRYEN